MPAFKFRGPDGTVRTIEAPTREQAIEMLRGQVSGTPPPGIGSPTHPTESPQDFGSTPANLAAGVGQGLLDPIEGGVQLLEHAPYIGGAVSAAIPSGLREGARRFRQRAEASTAGEIGEVAGNILPFLFQPELGLARGLAAVPKIGKALGFGGRVLERGTLPAALEPVDTSQGGDFASQKLAQTAVGTVLGTGGEAVASTLGRAGARQATQQAAAQKAASEHAAALQAHQTASLARASEQTARQTAATTKAGVPGETTLRWQQETLNRIGLGGQAPTQVTPEASARVQKLVGDRLNQIVGRMRLDPTDPAFTETINTIRDETSRVLPESAQRGWYREAPTEDLPGLILDPTTGRPLARRTRAGLGEPPKATGDFVKTVMEPLEKGELSGRSLTDYISRLGARAEELARKARTVPQDKRAELYAQSNALRQIEDAVIGHAAGDPADKTALEAARKAYSMWSIGNEAGRASQAGVMTPARLIQTISRRMGEARYKQALADPNHPDHAILQYLQSQLGRHSAALPPVRAASAVPRHPGAAPSGAPPPAAHPAAQAAANALLHWGLWHVPGLGHAAYWFGRPALHAAAQRAAPAMSRAAGRATGRGTRRAIAPVSATAANVAEQVQEPRQSWVRPSVNFP